MSIPSWARVGANVVCVNGKGWTDADTGLYGQGPSKGDICVISGVVFYGSLDWYLRLVGWPAPEDEFWLWSFRPLTTRTLEQDVSIFKPLLTPKDPVPA